MKSETLESALSALAEVSWEPEWSESTASSDEIELLSLFWRRNTCFRFKVRSRQLSRRRTFKMLCAGYDFKKII